MLKVCRLVPDGSSELEKGGAAAKHAQLLKMSSGYTQALGSFVSRQKLITQFALL